MKNKEIKEAVKGRYGQMAKQDQQKQGCCPSCSASASTILRTGGVGYSKEDLEHIPESSLMGLGCGNPIAIAELQEGETVLDLGSGAGVDVFLAANKVGPTGRVIGVDMTEEMVNKARSIARDYGYANVEFRLGEIEQLPVEDNSVNAIISNCVINLSTDKSRVFREAYRVLKPGGRLTVSDIVSEGAIPDEMKNDPEAWTGCIAGALQREEYLDKIRKSGFGETQILSSREFYIENRADQTHEKLFSVTVKAQK
jgi:arsenite methyltransferase